jgi:hypothetical protein
MSGYASKQVLTIVLNAGIKKAYWPDAYLFRVQYLPPYASGVSQCLDLWFPQVSQQMLVVEAFARRQWNTWMSRPGEWLGVLVLIY